MSSRSGCTGSSSISFAVRILVVDDAMRDASLLTKGLKLASPPFPDSARIFLTISTPARSRIFLFDAGVDHGSPDALTSVATVPGSTDAGELVNELNRAAATGNRASVDEILLGLPGAVSQAITKALDSCPDASTLAMGFDDQPMTVLRESYFRPGSDDLVREATSAMNLGLQYLIQNSIGDEGALEFTAQLLSDEAQVPSGHDLSWWPATELTMSERLQPDPRELAAVLADERWETKVGRAYWLWVEDPDSPDDDSGTTATAEWVVEFFEEPLSPDTNFQIFRVRGDHEDGYLSARNRFFLWRSLWNISVDLDGALSDDYGTVDTTVEGMESMVLDDMPGIVRGQPRVWWERLRDAADRLCEAARTGELSDIRPRTVGEEALIALAVRDDYIEWAQDSLESDEYQQVFDSLPTSSHDGEWGEILPALTGDIDVEMLWQPHLDGIDNPTNAINIGLGMEDYRAASWHSLFDRVKDSR